ncbi:MAG: biopolymer transporter ExbD [Moraxellaceae bacterium]|nr:biopolymer transporter ExbD [Pseudobdellovibrionaceae bacterium]
MKHKKKHLDFELNLIPFIDLLSTCICFLLITAVWMQVGSLNVKQAVGGQPASETEKKPTAWIYMEKDGSVTFDVKDSPALRADLRKSTVPAKAGKLDLELVNKLAADLRTVDPGLRTALIQPKPETSYEDIIDLMDTVKKAGLGDLGVVPL